MRKLFASLTLLAFLLVGSVAYSAVAIIEDGTYQGEATAIDLPSTWVTFSGSTATVSGGEGVIRFYPTDFVTVDTSGTMLLLTTGTTPKIAINNGSASIVWGDGAESYATVTFEVPADYSSGASFRVLCDQSDSDTRVSIDFEVVINTTDTEATAWAGAANHTDETAVAKSLLQSGSPETVTLTPTSTIVAGNLVTFNMWRDDVHAVGATYANATADLEVYYVEFYYLKQ